MGLILVAPFVVLGLIVCLLWPSSPKQSSGGFQVSVYYYLWLQILVAISGLALSAILSIIYHFDDVTHTHCGVYNFFPSVSASIGNNAPQTYIWRYAVGFHNAFVMWDSLALYHAYVNHLPKTRFNIITARVSCFLRAASCFNLFLLTFVSSTEDFDLHEAGFLLWIVCGFSSMVLQLYMYLKGLNWKMRSEREIAAFRFFGGCITTYVLGLIGAAVTYYVHNTYCYPYVYSFFGMSEWVVILSYVFGNGGAHWAFDYAYLDSKYVITIIKKDY